MGISRAQSSTGNAPQPESSLRIARLLIAQEPGLEKSSEPAIVGAALDRTCSRVLDNLCDSLGESGCTALLARAIARIEADHSVLASILRRDDGKIHLDGVVASVESHGIAAVTGAIEALLAALVEILGRLIGEDMAIRLIDDDTPRPQTGGGAFAA